MHERLNSKFTDSKAFEKLTGLVFLDGWEGLGVRTSEVYGRSPAFQISSLKLVNRAGPSGKIVNQIVMTLIQRSGVEFTVKECVEPGAQDNPVFKTFIPDNTPLPENRFEFKGGCTLIFDLDTLELKYCIRKPLLDISALDDGTRRRDEERIRKQFDFLFGQSGKDEYELYFGYAADNSANEPFKFLHW